MFNLLCILYSYHHCVVGAGPAGITMAHLLSKQFPNDQITLMGDDKNGGNLNKVKNELSNTPYHIFNEYGINMQLDHLDIFKSFKAKDRFQFPLISEIVEMVNQIRNDLNRNGNFIHSKVTRIDRVNHQFELQLIRNEIQNCDFVYLALGGIPKPFIDLNGNPQQFDMYESLEMLNESNARDKLYDKQIYIVGDGDTSRWMQNRLNSLKISFELIKIKHGSDDDDEEEKEMNSNDYVFYAHGLQSANLPEIKIDFEETIGSWLARNQYNMYHIKGSDAVIYGLGAMVKSGQVNNFWFIADLIIENVYSRIESMQTGP
eukprot:NODE_143_length_15882_cov_1.296585.p7 type:complete len:317 gc:universal NODE_143_length_15882_cov_1.296585:7969-8919(+)